MIRALTNIVFYGKRQKKQRKILEKQIDKEDSMIDNASFFLAGVFSVIFYLFDKWFSFVLLSYHDIKSNYKNASHNNVVIAKNLLKEGNHLDATFRLKIAIILDKNNFHALLTLAYLYYEHEKYKKSLKYFKTLQAITSESQMQEINFMIEEINLKLSK